MAVLQAMKNGYDQATAMTYEEAVKACSGNFRNCQSGFFLLHNPDRKKNENMSSSAAFILIKRTKDSETEASIAESNDSLDILKYFSEAHFTVMKSSMGFRVLQIRFNGNELYRENFQEKTKEVLKFGKKLNTSLILLSLYEYQREIKWIENEILSPFVLEDYGSLQNLPVDRIWKIEDLRDAD